MAAGCQHVGWKRSCVIDWGSWKENVKRLGQGLLLQRPWSPSWYASTASELWHLGVQHLSPAWRPVVPQLPEGIRSPLTTRFANQPPPKNRKRMWAVANGLLMCGDCVGDFAFAAVALCFGLGSNITWCLGLRLAAVALGVSLGSAGSGLPGQAWGPPLGVCPGSRTLVRGLGWDHG